MALGASIVLDHLSAGNVLLGVVFLFFLYQLVELYPFRNMPPGPRFPVLPLLGHALKFDFNADNFTDATKNLCSGRSDVFSFKLGKYKLVVARSAEAVKEVLVTRSADYAGRPLTALNLATTSGGKSIAFGNYGPAWRLHRKLFTGALRQYLSDIPLIESRVCTQCENLLLYLEEQEERPFDPSDILARSVANVICGIAFGEGFDTTNPDMKQLLEINQRLLECDDYKVSASLDFFSFAEYLPSSRRIIAANERKLEIYRSHLKQRQHSFDPDESICDLTSGLIKAQRDAQGLDAEERAVLLSDDYIINTISDMFFAGYETTSTALKWALAFLVNHPQIQADIQHQLDVEIGREREPSLHDRHELPLFWATIMEVMRIGNVAPLTLMHMSLNDTKLCGYDVPKDTITIVDLEAVHLDPKCWENPTVFDPYRHIDEDNQLITNQGNLYPFSAGRRVCAGEPLAKVELFLFLSWMLHRFTFVADESGPPELKGVVTPLTQAPKLYKIRAIKRQ